MISINCYLNDLKLSFYMLNNHFLMTKKIHWIDYQLNIPPNLNNFPLLKIIV